MPRPDGYLIQQRRRNSDDEWEIDPTEYPLDTARETRARLEQLVDEGPDSEWRGRPFTLGSQRVLAPKK